MHGTDQNFDQLEEHFDMGMDQNLPYFGESRSINIIKHP